MIQNVLKLIMLLSTILLMISSCSSLGKTYNEGVRENTTSRSTSKNSKTQLRKSMVNDAKQYIGIPYKYAGKIPKTGFDCSGFTCYVMNKYDVDISSGSKYQAETGREIPLKRVQPGDLIFFGKGRKVSHVAMVTRNTSEGIEVIHSTSSKGVMVQNISKSSYWKPKILFARDVIGR